MRLLRKSREGFGKISSFLGLPPPVAKKNYQRHCAKLNHAAEVTAEESMKKAAQDVLQKRTEAEEEAPSDIAITTDGTWMRRGFSSLYGVQTVISWDTRKVIDVEILSHHCTICTNKEALHKKGQLSSEDLASFKLGHAPVCQANTAVLPPSMEGEAAKLIWARSKNLHNLRYTNCIGDADSSSYHSVCVLKPYGDKAIVKEECVGHVQKCLGRNLRTHKQRCGSKLLADGKPIGGRNRLRHEKINSYQNFYGNAIRNSGGSVPNMARRIWALICHNVEFPDVTKHHQFCPERKDSWCKWQANKDTCTVPHNRIPVVVFDEIKPVYVYLADKSLLERCTRSATQNANEAQDRSHDFSLLCMCVIHRAEATAATTAA